MDEAPLRDRLLAGAIELITELPISKITMDDVARRAGVVRQTVYKHFAGKDELLAALFAHEMRTVHHPALRSLHSGPPGADRLVDMFLTELELARRYVLLSHTFDPAVAPRIAELVLSSPEIQACQLEVWGPILADYQSGGLVRADLDLSMTVRWMTYQHVWLLSHPTALTGDADELRRFVRTYLVDAMLVRP